MHRLLITFKNCLLKMVQTMWNIVSSTHWLLIILWDFLYTLSIVATYGVLHKLKQTVIIEHLERIPNLEWDTTTLTCQG